MGSSRGKKAEVSGVLEAVFRSAKCGKLNWSLLLFCAPLPRRRPQRQAHFLAVRQHSYCIRYFSRHLSCLQSSQSSPATCRHCPLFGQTVLRIFHSFFFSLVNLSWPPPVDRPSLLGRAGPTLLGIDFCLHLFRSTSSSSLSYSRPAWTGARASPTFSPSAPPPRPQPNPSSPPQPPAPQTNGARPDQARDRVLQSLTGLTVRYSFPPWVSSNTQVFYPRGLLSLLQLKPPFAMKALLPRPLPRAILLVSHSKTPRI